MGWPWAPLTAFWALGIVGATALRIGAFNVQSFGDHKASDPDCGSVIAQILAGYDIALVQEVRDPDLSAVSLLMEQINSVSKHEYGFVSSKPLGRDQYKEMYLFVYRKDVVSVVSTYQYPDPEDAFSREPFVVKFSAPGCGELIPPPPSLLQAFLDSHIPTFHSRQGASADPPPCSAKPGGGGDRCALRRVPRCD